jgi:hypothetical protein
VVTAILAAQSFARFLDDEADDHKRGYGVDAERGSAVGEPNSLLKTAKFGVLLLWF